MRQVSRLRDGTAPSGLPTLVERNDFGSQQAGELADACFVHQLRWVGAGRQLDKAMVDYYRAYTQTVAVAGGRPRRHRGARPVRGEPRR